MTRAKTVRTIPWQGKKPSKVLKGKPLVPSAAVSLRYYWRLRGLIRRMSVETRREIKELFDSSHAKEYFAEDASIASQARILMSALSARFDDLFGTKSKTYAEDVVNESAKHSASTLKLSLAELAEGVTLKVQTFGPEMEEIVKASIAENVSLIKSIPSQYFTQVQGAVMRSITTGQGMADLVPFIKKYEGVTLNRARLIASDQTRKITGNINRAHMESVGLKKFEWLHTHGEQFPRPLHRDVLNGNVYSFANPPVIDKKTGERGFPGQLIGCKCAMVPVIDFESDF